MLAQKKCFLFVEARNTLSSLICSTIHSSLLSIRLAKRFFAFFDTGVTNAVSMILEVDWIYRRRLRIIVIIHPMSDSVKNLENLVAILTLGEKRNCEFFSHECLCII